jgi:hypothetical protein
MVMTAQIELYLQCHKIEFVDTLYRGTKIKKAVF